MKKIFSILTCASILTTAAPFVGAEEIKVEKGDTLWSISQEKNVSINDIKKWNDLDSDIIKVNDTLTIQEEKKHKVKAGDNLWKISQKYNTTVDQLKEWNKLKSDTIHKDDVLIVSKNNGSTSSKTNITTVNKAVKAENTINANTNTTAKSKEITVEATAYTADCKGCSGVTATGINLKDNPNKKVISVDPSVIPLGSTVYVEGYGTAIAGDTGGAIKGKKIDVHVATKSEALNWGRKQVSVKILD
ncbi:LysM peptidoglycan-binding domain-containing protein [Cytobacillus oceanisediminis]|uniref:LysM peptidoglycan-binding domain-containing protein n=1 Tax=Niallia alba TaxID=2729105 RepID=A0A7Y0PMH1_9BACI|nr:MULTISPECIES: 3D domain-containing protein [Bacillaceae]MBZ9535092.1 LysM peptidoglycan-binding domain-containing protein [Cytobacillus oceanisediminis]NMO77795.1 LysM peptidoglycan-binding domain-containing protein [Niallia alba]